MLSLPPDAILEIIYAMRKGDASDTITLQSIAGTCRALAGTMKVYRTRIIDHYTTTYNEQTLTQGTWTYYKFCGRLHRGGDLPAVMCDTGYCAWYYMGRWHRDGGLPAITYASGLMEYWVHGTRVYNAI